MADDDRTIFASGAGGNEPGEQAVELRYTDADGHERTARFVSTFRLGRGASCQVRLPGTVVSRQHAEVHFDGERWWVQDLDSVNGTFLNGRRVRHAALTPESSIQLGQDGPLVTAVVHGMPEPSEEQAPESVTEFVKRYFEAEGSGEGAGEHTMMVRKAFQRTVRKQKRRYSAIIGVVAVLLVGVGSFAGYQAYRINKMTGLATEIFYSMKQLELELMKVRESVAGDQGGKETLASKRNKLRSMREKYNNFIREAGLLDQGMTKEERLIYRVARIFGECEVNMPSGFVDEVKSYIHKWKTTDRLTRAMRRLHRSGHARTVYQAMLDKHLPPQFLYLALQESDFNARAVGPKTRYGIAKGPWQFIPDTAIRYGLQTGPLVEVPRYDPRDDRFKFEQATGAAAEYLHDIYSTEAQASGLLVIAGYNWGHNRVRRLIREMPENPRERNFWNLMERYQVPRQTHDYVFYIFSAAVIGENPDLFGFKFEDPFRRLEEGDDAQPAGAAAEPVS